MVLAYHVVFGAYGFWLPNDPRGSWSDFVRTWEIRRFGPATKVVTRASLAGRSHDRNERKAAKQALLRPPVSFTGLQAQAIGVGFADFAMKSKVTVWACSILPDHVHLVVGRHQYEVEQIVNHLKGSATRMLVAQNLHPFQGLKHPSGGVPKCFARGQWNVFLNSVDEIGRAIRYVEENPLKEGKSRQRWSFVLPFEGVGF